METPCQGGSPPPGPSLHLPSKPETEKRTGDTHLSSCRALKSNPLRRAPRSPEGCSNHWVGLHWGSPRHLPNSSSLPESGLQSNCSSQAFDAEGMWGRKWKPAPNMILLPFKAD